MPLVDTEDEQETLHEATNRLLVEMEIGQQAMPKPLLSGYFTNQLNSVHNVREGQKSLEDARELIEDARESALNGELNLIAEDTETLGSEHMQRKQLKIKQSLNRDFSIENLKKAAG